MSQACAHFDQLYQRDADPWQVHSRWYEQRKQAVLMACLPHRRYARAFETGCGTGALTGALAGRCEALLASDASDTAVRIARQHVATLAGTDHVRIEHQTLPRDWPVGLFDLIVIAEWAYYLSPPDLEALAVKCHASLTPEGCLVACHWRPDFSGRRLDTDTIHARLGHGPRPAGPGWCRLVHHEEDEFLLNIWSPATKAPSA